MTQLVVAVPASLVQAPGTRQLTVSNPSPGGGISLPLGFPVLAPTISSVTPTSIAAALPGGSPVAITVENGRFAQSNSRLIQIAAGGNYPDTRGRSLGVQSRLAADRGSLRRRMRPFSHRGWVARVTGSL
jgi:hypothetical protein